MIMQQEYQIQELADLADVSPRTIRYYTQEGLLPEPVSKGKFASYTDEHLDRLRLIRQLKDTYLPLKEIRQMMASLSWAEVRGLLREQSSGHKKPASGKISSSAAKMVKEPESALDYIHQLLENQLELSSPETFRLRSFSPQLGNESLFSQTKNPPETWRRIQLAPGVELHILEPYTAMDPKRIDELIAFAQKLTSS